MFFIPFLGFLASTLMRNSELWLCSYNHLYNLMFCVIIATSLLALNPRLCVYVFYEHIKNSYFLEKAIGGSKMDPVLPRVR